MLAIAKSLLQYLTALALNVLWKMVQPCHPQPACTTILSLPGNTAAQLAPIHCAASTWPTSLTAWASLSYSSKMKTMKGILKGFHLFALSVCSLSNDRLAQRATFYLFCNPAGSLSPQERASGNGHLIRALSTQKEDWWDGALRSCYHCTYHHYLKELFW